MSKNQNNQPLQQIAETMEKVNTGIIMIPANASADAIASATSLYIGLSQMGKSSSIVSSTPVQSDLTAADRIQQSLSTPGDSLVISFPYEDGNVDRIDWNIEGDMFNVVVVPRAGFPKLNSDNVQFSYAGGKTEFIFVLDAPNLNALGNIYTSNQEHFKGHLIINVDRHMVNNSYGTINYVDKTASSISELTMNILQELGCEIDKEIATNLYSGLVAATNNFSSPNVGANTFQIAATLLQAGAQKKQQPGVPNMMGQGTRPPMQNPFSFGGQPPPGPGGNMGGMYDPFGDMSGGFPPQPPMGNPQQAMPRPPMQQGIRNNQQGFVPRQQQQRVQPAQQQSQRIQVANNQQRQPQAPQQEQQQEPIQQQGKQNKPNVFQDLLNARGKKQ